MTRREVIIAAGAWLAIVFGCNRAFGHGATMARRRRERREQWRKEKGNADTR